VQPAPKDNAIVGPANIQPLVANPLPGEGVWHPSGRIVSVSAALWITYSRPDVDAHGNLVYAAGPGLNVETLAEILRRAGCVRAMELDINTWWVSFTVYTSNASGRAPSSNLLASTVRPPDRYLSDGTRDFFEIDRRH
jgi:hypothetical protein